MQEHAAPSRNGTLPDIPDAGPATGSGPDRGVRFRGLWAAALLLPALAFIIAATFAWRQSDAESRERLGHRVAILQEHALRAFEQQESLLTALQAHTAGMGWEAIATSDAVLRFMVTLSQGSPSAGLSLVAPDGHIASFRHAPRLPIHPPLDVSDRDYVRALARDDAPPGTFIGALVRSRPSGTLAIPLARARLGPDGRPDGGVIATAFATAFFAEFYAHLVEVEGEAIALVRTDGALLARFPPLPDPVGIVLPYAEALRNSEAAGPVRIGRAISPIDGEVRRYAGRRVGNYPVAVLFAQDASAVRAAWLQRLPPIALACILASALLLALTARARRSAIHETAALRAAAAAARRAQIEAEARAALEARLHAAERMSALGHVAAGVAHDVNNLVQSFASAARLLQRRADDPAEVRRLATLVGDAAARGARMTHRMLDFSRRQGSAAAAFDPAAALRRVEALLADNALGLGTRVRIDLPDGPLPSAAGERAEFETVILNLAGNARDAMAECREGGEIRIALAPVAIDAPGNDDVPADVVLAQGRYLRVTVSDTGVGMSPEVLARVGEAFFTTKPMGQGTGLGLSLARRFVITAGGALHLASTPGAGTTVTLWLREALRERIDARAEAPATA